MCVLVWCLGHDLSLQVNSHEIEEIRHEIQMIVTHERGSMKVVQEQGVEVVGSLHSVPYHQPPCGSSASCSS